MRNERGVALPLALIILTAMTALTIALLSLAAFQPQISKNLADATQARFAADAGVEWAFNVLASTPDWNTLLAGASSGGVTMIAGGRIGTLPAARGTYTVVVRNDTLPTDQQLTGVAPDTNPTSDGNGRLIVTSTGNVANAAKTIRVVATKLAFPPGLFPGALNFPGNEAETNFSGTAFTVDGNGWLMDGSGLDASCAPVFGVSVSPTLGNPPGSNEQVVENSLNNQQKKGITGKKQNPALAGTGNNTIAPDPVLTPQFVQNFIDQAKAMADITLQSTQGNPLSFNNIGSSCTGSATQDATNTSCWGSKDPSTGVVNPKIVYIKGDPDPTSAFHALTLGGTTTGYGILIVEDGDFIINGNFAWYGAIIVTGKWVGIGYMGGGNQTVYGSVISNETEHDPGYFEGWIAGNAKIRYSCQALANAIPTRKTVALTNWKELAPGE